MDDTVVKEGGRMKTRTKNDDVVSEKQNRRLLVDKLGLQLRQTLLGGTAAEEEGPIGQKELTRSSTVQRCGFCAETWFSQLIQQIIPSGHLDRYNSRSFSFSQMDLNTAIEWFSLVESKLEMKLRICESGRLVKDVITYRSS